MYSMYREQVPSYYKKYDFVYRRPKKITSSNHTSKPSKPLKTMLTKKSCHLGKRKLEISKKEKMIFVRSNSNSKPSSPVAPKIFINCNNIFDKVYSNSSDQLFFKNASEMFGEEEIKPNFPQEEEPFVCNWPQAPYNDNAYLMEYHEQDAPVHEDNFDDGMPIDFKFYGSNLTNNDSVGSKGLSRSEMKQLISLDFQQAE